VKRPMMVVLALALVAGLFTSPATAASQDRSYILLGSNDRLPADLQQKVQAAGGTVVRTLPEIGIAVVSSSNASFKDAVGEISGVRSIAPNIKLQYIKPVDNVVLEETGNPPNSGNDDRFFDLQWGHDAINAPEAWKLGYRGKGVRVAVLDDGIDSDHPDLAPNLNVALSTSFVPGEPFEYTEPDPFSHGTHVAGTIAAADNGIGVIGVAPEAELVAVKVLSSATGSGTFEGIIAAIMYTAKIQADVANMSLGAVIPRHGTCDENGCANAIEIAELQIALARATMHAHAHGVTLIASAGNEAINFDKNWDQIHIPSMSPGVISISATAPEGWALNPNTNLDLPASYTNIGMEAVDFAAPGGDFDFESDATCTVAGITRLCWIFDMVFSTGSQGRYYWSAGTSMAAPHASGVAALIIGKNGGSAPAGLVEHTLIRSSDDLGPRGKDPIYGFGRVNAYRAVRQR